MPSNKDASKTQKASKPPYLSEPILNSEIVLINNAKKLKDNPELFCDTHLTEIQTLRDEYLRLESLKNNPKTNVKGLTAEMREVRNHLRDVSKLTYVDRDTNLFGQMVIAVAHGVTSQRKFAGYSFRDEMESLARDYIIRYVHNFDTDRRSKITGQHSSAFAYLSTIANNACVQTINKFNKNNTKAKEAFLETQKLIHRDPNRSTIGADFSEATRVVKFTELADHELKRRIKSLSIKEETKIFIPETYKITTDDMDFILKYQHNLSICRTPKAKGETNE